MKWLVAALIAAVLAAAISDSWVEAAEEVKKGEPADPTNKETPTDPSKKETPADPTNKETPADPTKKETPADPTNKETPTDPSKKKTPADPTNKKETPANPSKKETPPIVEKKEKTVAGADKRKKEAATLKEKAAEGEKQPRKPPNIVILVADDLGIGDVGCFGNDTIKTPNIDSLARDGVRLTHHLTASAYCSPSRAALLTARYPARYGFEGDDNTPPVVVHVASSVGLPRDEITLAKALAAANYTTAAVGKWHLGMGCGVMGKGCRGPQEHGFQHFYGLPLSLVEDATSDQPFFFFPLDGKDSFYLILLSVAIGSIVTLCFLCRHRPFMYAFFCFLLSIGLVGSWFLYTHYRFQTDKWWQVSPWMNKHLNEIVMDEEVVVEQPLALEGLSQRLASHSAALIARYAREDQPFFLYHSFAHVHTPMFTVPQMAGKSAHGRYGDNVEELDASVGEILAALHEHGLEDNTIVYFVSDNGGHLEAVGEDGQRIGGHNGRFKGGKGMGGAEGGIRVPGIYRWPGHIPAGVTMDTPTSLLDTLPTLLQLAGLPSLPELLPNLPPRDLDGVSIADVLTKGSYAPSRTLIHHCGKDIHAVRLVFEKTVFKLHFAGYKWKPGSTQCGWGGEFCSCFDVEDYGYEPRLYNLQTDPYEDNPLPADSSKYIQMTSIMLQFLAEWKARVPYPPSLFEKASDVALSPWLQPFRSPL